MPDPVNFGDPEDKSGGSPEDGLGTGPTDLNDLTKDKKEPTPDALGPTFTSLLPGS